MLWFRSLFLPDTDPTHVDMLLIVSKLNLFAIFSPDLNIKLGLYRMLQLIKPDIQPIILPDTGYPA